MDHGALSQGEARDIVEIGRLLTEVKAELEHGGWLT
jgi:hypothetical protein